MKIQSSTFGTLPDGSTVDIISVENTNGVQIKLIPYGATLVSCTLPIKSNPTEVTLGFDSLQEYTESHPYFGSTIGRVANRMENATMHIHNRNYALSCNHGKHSLHGGHEGFHRRMWQYECLANSHAAEVIFFRTSPHDEEGYPGELDVVVCYRLTENNELWLEYRAHTKKNTMVNLTNHTYWNLAGKGNILDHDLIIFSDKYLPTDDEVIPIGEVFTLNLTALDFRRRTKIGRRINELPNGYDYYYLLAPYRMYKDELDLDIPAGMAPAAILFSPSSNASMEMYTDYPGLQFYSGHYLKGIRERNGRILAGCDALCLEAHLLPNGLEIPNVPSSILSRGDQYHYKTVYRFVL